VLDLFLWVGKFCFWWFIYFFGFLKGLVVLHFEFLLLLLLLVEGWNCEWELRGKKLTCSVVPEFMRRGVCWVGGARFCVLRIVCFVWFVFGTVVCVRKLDFECELIGHWWWFIGGVSWNKNLMWLITGLGWLQLVICLEFCLFLVRERCVKTVELYLRLVCLI